MQDAGEIEKGRVLSRRSEIESGIQVCCSARYATADLCLPATAIQAAVASLLILLFRMHEKRAEVKHAMQIPAVEVRLVILPLA